MSTAKRVPGPLFDRRNNEDRSVRLHGVDKSYENTFQRIVRRRDGKMVGGRRHSRETLWRIDPFPIACVLFQIAN